MQKHKRVYALVIILLGMGIFNLSRNMDFTHHVINLIGLALISYSLIFGRWESLNSKRQ